VNSNAQPNPPRNGEGDRAKRGGGGYQPLPRPIVSRARQLRKQMTPPEIALWQYLRQRPNGLKFRNQHPIGNDYVADFCCISAMLVIEVDGEVHDIEQVAIRDLERDRYIAAKGFRIVRLSAKDILQNIRQAVEQILALTESPHHHPSDGPPPRSGED
jgi:very-short-patch-repair endonuclease